MTIRARALAGLGLIRLLAAIAIVFISIALTLAGRMDADRRRISETLTVHTALWRTLSALKYVQHHQIQYALPSARDRVAADRLAARDYFDQLEILIVAPDQRERLARLARDYARWTADWDAKAPQPGSPDGLAASAENDFAPIDAQLSAIDAAERQAGPRRSSC
ncbi:MAG: hypothetical protein FJZ00_02000 [Candidatus Sericytochromatia bacterium]|uniref:Uncharacterized protein n=1 Tax=Candidatus Tanganyikabacteria bacterium TaxID=2961651 RepID=A0A937X433_9BACT|nr:hypothetical protein [Candidatus Tanganyikabacteria bacterium]